MTNTEISDNNPEKELIIDKSISDDKTKQISKKNITQDKKIASKNDKSNKSFDEVYSEIFSDLVSRKESLVKEIQNSSENPIQITIERDGFLKDLTLVPKNVDGKGTVGAQLQPNIKKETKKTTNIFELFKYTNNEFLSLLVKTIQGYKGLITNFSSTAQQLSGPVKIVEIGAQLSQQGGTGILLFAALISINLAVLNSLPLPLLDGGQLVFTLIEGFRGKPVPVKVQMVVTQSSFFLLVGLSVLLIIRDTSQLLIVQRLLNQ